MLKLKYQSNLSNSVLKSYKISEPYTAIDCLKAMIRNLDVEMGYGMRNAEHDVGFDSDADHDRYESVDAFLASGDYEAYAGDDYISSYRFFGKYKGIDIEIGFADKGIMILDCNDVSLDLCAIIEGTDK